jgi:hypothetical protein
MFRKNNPMMTWVALILAASIGALAFNQTVPWLA